MCSCGKYKPGYVDPVSGETSYDDYWVGYVKGVYEVHTGDYCKTEKLRPWRYRLFAPLMRLGSVLAGAHQGGEQARLLYLSQVQRMRRGQSEPRRKKLTEIYEKMDQ